MLASFWGDVLVIMRLWDAWLCGVFGMLQPGKDNAMHLAGSEASLRGLVEES